MATSPPDDTHVADAVADEAAVNKELNPGLDVQENNANSSSSTSTSSSSMAASKSPKVDATTTTPNPKGPQPLPDFRTYIGMPGDHEKHRPTVNQHIWFIDYMVAELSDNNDELPFE